VSDSSEIRIVIAQRGWVFVGKYSTDGDDVVISGGSVIRRWGTTRGIGEIAANGPTKSTILDASPDIWIHKLSVVASIVANAEKWANYVVR
jgi:hypothetical protein